jgi:uncharacterized protein (TIGR02996 family)
VFTIEDKAFIRTILSNPAELSAWLVYADWLEEHDNPLHAEFLRLMARRGQLSNTELEWYTVEGRLEELRNTLDPNWVAVFDRPKIENCEPAFRYQCPRQWENLKALNEPAVRYCSACEKKVYYCHTLDEAKSHAWQGHCVAVQLGVLRYPDDLRPPASPEGASIGELIGALEISNPPPARRRRWWKFW